MKYLIIIEKGETNYGAYSPDVAGCIAVGDTPEEARQNMQEALKAHIEGLKRDGDEIPQPANTAEYLDVNVA